MPSSPVYVVWMCSTRVSPASMEFAASFMTAIGVGHRLALVAGDDKYCNASAGQVLLVRDPLVGGDQQLVSVAFSLVQEFAVSERVSVALKGGVCLVVR